MATRLRLDLRVFEENLARLERELERCAPTKPPKIVPVTKYLEPAGCEQLRAAGHGPFGESRADDLVRKVDRESDRLCWHFIGHLQRNKIRRVIPRVSLLHSLDNEVLASEIDRWLSSHSLEPLDCLVQVNVSGEATKGGIDTESAVRLIPEWCTHFPHLRIRGLMTMAPHGQPESCRPLFRSLRDLRDRIRLDLEGEQQSRFTELSMGMSNDYRIAAEEGATLIRLGRILFERPR